MGPGALGHIQPAEIAINWCDVPLDEIDLKIDIYCIDSNQDMKDTLGPRHRQV